MTIHPALLLVFTAAVAATIRRSSVRALILLAGAVTSLVSCVGLTPGVALSFVFTTHRVELLRVDPLSQVFGLIFTLITVIGFVYALHIRSRGEQIATALYAAGALGVVYAGDWITLFVSWEFMSLTSLIVIWSSDRERARAAGFRYLLVHIAGGSLLFVGLMLLSSSGAGLGTVGLLEPDIGPAFWLILAGICINAAIPPVHAWLTDAYPEASVTGMVFLSAFTTKTAVYVLIRVFPGTEVLVWLGATAAVYGAFYAVLENDIRRLLAYHIVSQVGYMVAGVGMGSALALNGAAAHAFSHVLYKALLIMSLGAVIQMTGKRKLTELGGVGRSMPIVIGLFFVGAFAISGVPLFNGFISKSMIVTAATELKLFTPELLLTLATVGTILHTCLKLPYFTFFGPDCGVRPGHLPRNMLVAMTIAAACCITLGLQPEWLYNWLPLQPVMYSPYTSDHVLSSVQLIIGTGVGFCLLFVKLAGTPTITLDTDQLWRRPVWLAVNRLTRGLDLVQGSAQAVGFRVRNTVLPYAENPLLLLALGGFTPTGFDRERYDADRYRLPIAVTVFWVTAALVALILFAWITVL